MIRTKAALAAGRASPVRRRFDRARPRRTRALPGRQEPRADGRGGDDDVNGAGIVNADTSAASTALQATTSPRSVPR